MNIRNQFGFKIHFDDGDERVSIRVRNDEVRLDEILICIEEQFEK